MAKATLPTNYQDDILNVSTEGKRKYRMVYNDDGTVSFDDVTPYDQEGSDFGAGDINATNEAVNQSLDKAKVIDDLETIQAVTNEGFVMGALAGKALNESLVGLMGFPNYENVLATLTASKATYTATQNCILIGHMQCTANSTSAVKINNTAIVNVGMSDSTNYRPQVPVYLPIMEGQTVSTGNSGNYNLTVYAMY